MIWKRKERYHSLSTAMMLHVTRRLAIVDEMLRALEKWPESVFRGSILRLQEKVTTFAFGTDAMVDHDTICGYRHIRASLVSTASPLTLVYRTWIGFEDPT
jgi:hypothetical protein